jgi:hypothetical protein
MPVISSIRSGDPGDMRARTDVPILWDELATDEVSIA